MMEAVRTSETSVDNHSTRQDNPEDSSEHQGSSLMMEAVRTSETSVDNHSTRQYNPEDSSEHKPQIFYQLICFHCLKYLGKPTFKFLMQL
jgi:hypothetical protein